MKKLITIMAIVSLFGIGCAKKMEPKSDNIQKDTRSPQFAFINMVPDETGELSSTGAVAQTANPIRIGKDGSTEYRAILSFDTSVIPFQILTGFSIWVGFQGTNGETQEELMNYLKQNLVIEMGGYFGFGNNNALQASDYSAFTWKTVPLMACLIQGGGIVLPPDAWPYVNRNGHTQLRLRFASNPQNKLINMGWGMGMATWEQVGN